MNNVISTKVSMFRNLKEYKFNPKLETNKKEEIIDRLKSVLGSKMSLISVNETNEKVISSLKTSELINNNTLNLFISKDNTIIDLFNDEHMCINTLSNGFSDEIFKKVKSIVDLIASKIELAYNDEYGYLFSDLNKLGVGLKFESKISLPAIMELGKIEQVKINMRKLGYELKETKFVGIFSLNSLCNLGFSEKEIKEDYEKILTNLDELEIESEKLLDATKHDELVDRVNRSKAILESAYLMNYEELNRLTHNLLIGKNLKLVDVDSEKINKIQNLLKSNTEFISQSELKDLATTVQKIIKGE